ncbi:BnaA09g55460D [Brassica napus]|nr:BnaA09g55460D [Brassica napus]
MSLSLLSPTSSVSSPLVCPQCDLDFLERMDDESSPTLFDVTIGDGEQDDHDDDDDDDEDWCFVDPTVNSDDNFLLDSPYLHRLLRHLASENSGSSSSSSSSSSSLLKSSDIDSIPTIQISSSILSSDPDPDSVLLCAVCKEDFTVGESAKRLPCSHIYHSDCIVPWLSDHNSCPLCRFELPAAAKKAETVGGGGSDARIRLSDLASIVDGDEEEDDWLGIRNALRRLARRHEQMRLGVGEMERSLARTVSGLENAMRRERD